MTCNDVGCVYLGDASDGCIVSQVIEGAFIAIFLFKFLKPRPLVRFSSCCLVCDNRLSFRMVRESSYELSDCQIVLHARLMGEGGEGTQGLVSASLVQLELDHSTMLHLDVWEVHHTITEDSPLCRTIVSSK